MKFDCYNQVKLPDSTFYIMTQNDLKPKITNNIEHQAGFFTLSSELLCVLDSSGKILQLNPAMKMAFDFIEHPILGQRLAHLLNAQDSEGLSEIFDKLDELDNLISFESHFRGYAGTLKWYLWTIYPQASHVFYVVGRDITPYKEMENKELERNIFAEALLDTVLAINASLALEQVLKRILSNIGKVVAYDYVNILLVEDIRADWVGCQTKTPYQIDVNLKNRQMFSIPEHDYLNYLFESRECLIVSDVTQPPVWMISPEADHTSGSFLGAPIVFENAVIGFLSIFNSQKDFFTPLHAQQLMTFANQVAIAIINARLYEQSQSVAILRERQRVAQELHDSVNQELFAASTYADLLLKAIHSKPEAIQRYANDISKLVRGAVEQMRMILIELHPDTLTRTALPILIKQLGETFSNRTGIKVDFKTNNHTFILNPNDQIAIYRIIQESLHNIDKHSHANLVSINIQHSAMYLGIIITDNGIGFDPQQITEFQFGIRGMQERAESIRAEVLIDSEIGHGTSIKISCKKDNTL